jgi:hypothetical protein
MGVDHNAEVVTVKGTSMAITILLSLIVIAQRTAANLTGQHPAFRPQSLLPFWFIYDFFLLHSYKSDQINSIPKVRPAIEFGSKAVANLIQLALGGSCTNERFVDVAW